MNVAYTHERRLFKVEVLFIIIVKQFDIQIHSKLFKVDYLSSVLGLQFHIKCWYIGGGGGALDTSYDKVLRCVQTNLI